MNTCQATAACPSCGSWYHNGSAADGNVCNICGAICQDPAEKHNPTFTGGGTSGRLWSKLLHRYLTEDERKQGVKGG
jgi:hypothetical protein